MSKIELTGGCRCQKIRFRASVENPRTVLCACKDCQRASGSTFAHGVGVKKEHFQLIEGIGSLKSYDDLGESGKEVLRFFCSNCGSQLFGEPKSYPGYLSVRVPSLDQELDLEPSFAIFQENIPSWIELPAKMLEEGKKLGG